MNDHLIAVAPDHGAFVSVQTADQTTLYPVGGGAFGLHGLTRAQMHAADVGLDYYDAANEDAHGRLPHDPGFGSPLVLVPDPPAADILPLPAVPRTDAA